MDETTRAYWELSRAKNMAQSMASHDGGEQGGHGDVHNI
jgi:hypothetical protein